MMPRFPKAQKRPDNTPVFLVTARSFCGEAFGPRRKADLAESMADWAELTEEEQSFALAHLQYLNQVAQAGTQRLLLQVRELLAEIEDGVSEALEEVDEAHGPEGDLVAGDDELADIARTTSSAWRQQLPTAALPPLDRSRKFDDHSPTPTIFDGP